jgi:hypothetical protein
MPVASRTFDALLFDLGGVVLSIDFDRMFARWPITLVRNWIRSVRGSPSMRSTHVTSVGRLRQAHTLRPYGRPCGST